MKNVPNILTSIRFLLIAVFIWAFFSSAVENNIFWSMIVFVTAGITDVLDGYLARKHEIVSDFGKLMDPLADKLMMLTALICLYIRDYIPLAIILIICMKDIFLIAGGAFLYKKRSYAVQSNKLGKVTAVLLNASLIAIAFRIPYAKYILFFSVGLGIAALIQYVLINCKRELS